jgi:glycosyltransferase involved in cell wall biosynthesis
VSHEIASELARQGVVAKKKLCVLPNGIDTDKFAQPVDKATLRQSLGIPRAARVIGTVGRLSDVKCQDLLLRAFAAVTRRVAEAHLLLVGDGPMRKSLTQLAADLGIANAVHFAGYQEEPAPFYQAMDVFALTSQSEGMPLAVLEAWASGVPVVASAVGAVPRMIQEGRTGMLFPSGDEASLVRLLLELLGNDQLGRRMADEGRAHVVAEYGLERVVADYERHYRDLLGKTGTGPLNLEVLSPFFQTKGPVS